MKELIEDYKRRLRDHIKAKQLRNIDKLLPERETN
jgi:hypothetical protein